MVLVLLALLALSILLAFPNRALNIYDVLLLSGPKGHVTKARSLWPSGKASTPTLVASAAVLASAGGACWPPAKTSKKSSKKAKSS